MVKYVTGVYYRTGDEKTYKENKDVPVEIDCYYIDNQDERAESFDQSEWPDEYIVEQVNFDGKVLVRSAFSNKKDFQKCLKNLSNNLTGFNIITKGV